MKIRNKFTLALGSLVVCASLLFPLFHFYQKKKVLLEGIDQKLLSTVLMAREILGPEFHDRIVDEHSLTQEEYLRIVDRWNRICRELNLEYLWSLMELEGRIVFTSGTATSKTIEKGDHAGFLETHGNPELYREVFSTMKTHIQTNIDKWGDIRVALVPFQDKHGRKYLFGSSMKTESVQTLLYQTLWQSIFLGGTLFLFASAVSYVVSNSLTKGIEMVTQAAERIKQGQLNQALDLTGSDEVESLSDSISQMSRTIQKTVADLRTSEERYRLMIQHSPDVSVVMDSQGTTEYVSPQIQALAGYAPDYFLRQPILTLIHPEDTAMVQDAVRRAISGEELHDFQYRILTQNNQVGWVSHISIPIRENGQITKIFNTIRDISERKQAEARRLQLEEQLAHAQKMESIGRLAGGVAHDFNNMLAVILGYGYLLVEEVPAESAWRENLLEIIDAGERAKDLTRQLLAFSRKQLLEVRALDLNQVVRNMEKMIRRILGEDVEVCLRLQPGIGTVKADLSQLEQVLMNLCVNARDAMPNGGLLTIKTSVAFLDELSIHVQPGFFVVLAVSDTGIGMDEDTRKKAFDPFFTTKEKGKGTGLGLSTVFGIVKQHGGEIVVSSEPGKGASFQVYLPQATDATEMQREIPEERLVSGTGETILVMEDDVSVRKMTCQILTHLGYKVLESETIQGCIELATHSEQLDLLLTDVIMPEMNGRKLHEILVAIRPDLKTLFMTGYAEDIIGQHGILEDDIHLITKPFNERTLSRKIRQILG